MTTVECLHLDTTVQLRRIAYDSTEAERFNAELAGKSEVFTTSLVYREFLKTIIADIEYLYTSTEQIPADRDGRLHLGLLPQFLGASNRYTSRSIKRLHLVMGRLLARFARTKAEKGKVLTELERMAERYQKKFFEFPDLSSRKKRITCLCGLESSPQRLKELREAAPFPPAQVFPERAAAFLEARREKVERVEVEMATFTLKKGRDDRLLNLLKKLKDDDGAFDFLGRLPRYKSRCWYLGDLLIALECPADVAVYSTDRAFTILTKALGKPLYRGYGIPQ